MPKKKEEPEKSKKKLAKKVLKPGSVDGRPTLYSEEMADRICTLVATHTEGLPRLCIKYPDLPSDTVIYEWRIKYPDFAGKYAQAKLKQAEIFAEEIVCISDDSGLDYKIDDDGKMVFNGEAVARARLRVDTRKWLASKLLPKAYGDRGLVEELKSQNDEMMRELVELREKLDKKNQKDY